MPSKAGKGKKGKKGGAAKKLQDAVKKIAPKDGKGKSPMKGSKSKKKLTAFEKMQKRQEVMMEKRAKWEQKNREFKEQCEDIRM